MSDKSQNGPNNKPVDPGPPEHVRARLRALGVPAALVANKPPREMARAVLDHLRATARRK